MPVVVTTHRMTDHRRCDACRPWSLACTRSLCALDIIVTSHACTHVNGVPAVKRPPRVRHLSSHFTKTDWIFADLPLRQSYNRVSLCLSLAISFVFTSSPTLDTQVKTSTVQDIGFRGLHSRRGCGVDSSSNHRERERDCKTWRFRTHACRERRRIAAHLVGSGSNAQFQLVPRNLDGSARFVEWLYVTGEIVFLMIKVKSERT
jgi:hypothetical protein